MIGLEILKSWDLDVGLWGFDLELQDNRRMWEGLIILRRYCVVGRFAAGYSMDHAESTRGGGSGIRTYWPYLARSPAQSYLSDVPYSFSAKTHNFWTVKKFTVQTEISLAITPARPRQNPS